ncbi:MAG: AmmeMemoRadiSam system radical SAM enzyme [Phycisphaerae bacterium]|nr:AmmeMemoRadiSam system radical SAM enzyme [Phycisphaerae bacterium]
MNAPRSRSREPKRPNVSTPPPTPLNDLSRREILRDAVCAGCALTGLPALARAQDAAADSKLKLAGPELPGVVRHPAMFWDKQPDSKVLCQLCPRECRVADVERGYCGVRENRGGQYQTLVYGALCSLNVDPIEKKPLFHYLPGTTAASIATAGCNMECKFCQNWEISQFRPEQVPSRPMTPDRFVELVKGVQNQHQCHTIAYTYSEPTIYYEFMHDAAAAARQHGLGSVSISNGYILEKPLRKLCAHLTGIKVDLKAFTEDFYKKMCAAKLKPVLDALQVLASTGIWTELVILIIPTLNDSPDEIGKMAKWVVKNLGPNVPMHFTRFHPTYRVKNLPATPVQTVERARKIALDAGVRYAYVGNVPWNEGENTYCHSCHTPVIERRGFMIRQNKITDGKCPKCQTTIPGVWTQAQALSFKPKA